MGSPKVGTYWDGLDRNYQYKETEDQRYLVNMIIKDRNWSVFEASTGTGIIPTILRKAGFEGDYLGSDYCDVFIKHAQTNNPSERFIFADLGAVIDLPDNSYDCCVVRHGLEYVYPYLTALKELKRIARKYVYLVFWVDFVEGNNIRFNEEHNWNVNYYDEKEFYDTLKNLGYEVIEDTQVKNDNGKSNHILKLKV